MGAACATILCVPKDATTTRNLLLLVGAAAACAAGAAALLATHHPHGRSSRRGRKDLEDYDDDGSRDHDDDEDDSDNSDEDDSVNNNSNNNSKIDPGSRNGNHDEDDDRKKRSVVIIDDDDDKGDNELTSERELLLPHVPHSPAHPPAAMVVPKEADMLSSLLLAHTDTNDQEPSTVRTAAAAVVVADHGSVHSPKPVVIADLETATTTPQKEKKVEAEEGIDAVLLRDNDDDDHDDDQRSCTNNNDNNNDQPTTRTDETRSVDDDCVRTAAGTTNVVDAVDSPATTTTTTAKHDEDKTAAAIVVPAKDSGGNDDDASADSSLARVVVLSGLPPLRPRVPETLQAVFLSSNRGAEVHQPPPLAVANKVFRRNWVFQHDKMPSSSSLLSSSHDKVDLFLRTATRTMGTKTPRRPSYQGHGPKIAPQALLDEWLQARGYSTEVYRTLQTGYYNAPTAWQRASYGPVSLEWMRDNNATALRRACGGPQQQQQQQYRIWASNPCNAHGESLLHGACRRGNLEVLQALLEAGATVQISDDYGRTPLHDACWAAEPNFEIVTVLMERDPHLWYLQDRRGALPLAYAHRDHYPAWREFLTQTNNSIWDRCYPWENPQKTDPPPLATVPPHSQIPNESEAEVAAAATKAPVSRLDVAALVAKGRLSLEDAQLLLVGEEEEEDGGTCSESEDEDFSDDDDDDDDDDYFSSEEQEEEEEDYDDDDIDDAASELSIEED